jgi:hypothetical protein
MPGRDSIVGMAIPYGLDGPEFEFRCAYRFPLLQTNPDRHWGPQSFLCNVYGSSLPGVKRYVRGVDNTPPSGADVKNK